MTYINRLQLSFLLGSGLRIAETVKMSLKEEFATRNFSMLRPQAPG